VLPDLVLHEEMLATMTGEDAVREVLDKARSESAWAAENEIGPEHYLLKVEGVDYFISTLHLELHRVRIMQVCIKTFVVPRLQLVECTEENLQLAAEQEGAQKELEVAEIVLQSDLAALIPSLSKYLELENQDITAYRARMTVERAKFTKELAQRVQEEDTYMLHKYVDSEPMPLKVPAMINISVNMPLAEKSMRTLQASPQSSVDDLIVAAFKKFCAFSQTAAKGKVPGDYILKVTGFQDFLFGPEPIISYDYVRRSLSKEMDIILSLVETSEIVKQYPKERIDYVSIVDKVLAVPQVEDLGMKVVSVNKKNVGLKLKIKRVEGLTPPSGVDVMYFVRMLFIHGSANFMEPQYTKLSSLVDGNLIWDQVMFTTVTIPNIPLGVRLQFSLWQRVRPQGSGASDPKSIDSATDKCIGWVNFALFNSAGFMKSGLQAAILWTAVKEDEVLLPDPVGSCLQNVFAKDPITLFVDFEPSIYFKNPRMRPRLSEAPTSKMSKGASKLDAGGMLASLENIVKRDSLKHVSEEEKMLLWDNRNLMVQDPRALPKVALSCPWDDDAKVRELYELLRFWAPLNAAQAIELVGSNFSDPAIRAHGVAALDQLPDADVLAFLPQLVQALKFELNHDSALATLLVQRAFRCRHRIGHSFFWLLKSEMHIPSIAERYGLMLESYLRGCGSHRKELRDQVKAMDLLVEVAVKIKLIPSATRLKAQREMLAALQFPPVFQLPLDPRLQVSGLRIEKCKFMDSKKVPMWLVFNNAEALGDPVTIIFKEGDDLRQDALTLQILRICDKFWKEQGMDLRMNCYGAVATGDERGMIEVVLNSITMAGINKKAGGARKVLAKDTVLDFLKGQNSLNDDQLSKCQDNFTLSCAAYCVATYVLGIGDRHNDNIMVTMAGHLFHIDFGHFLGNYKEKFGIKRERAPFVFTPQYAAVIGDRNSDRWNQYVRRCKAAYNVLRKNANLLINLFHMMLSTGIPELRNEQDIEYLRTALSLDMTDEEAAKFIESLIYESLDCKTTRLNDIAHILAH
jgi:hypothetical protein